MYRPSKNNALTEDFFTSMEKCRKATLVHVSREGARRLCEWIPEVGAAWWPDCQA